MRKLSAIVWFLLFAVLAGSSSASAGKQEQCISDWTKAAAIVRHEGMIDVAALSKIARAKYNGKIITAKLCRDTGIYFYRLLIRRDDRHMQRVKVDAIRPIKDKRTSN